jgi:hypothetical protein
MLQFLHGVNNTQYYHQGRNVQSSDWPYVVLQLPKLWPCLDQLQATPQMFVVRWWTPAYRMPEETNEEPTLSCCNCILVEGEKPNPAEYRGCNHAKEEQHNELPMDLLGGHYSLSSW